MSQTINCPKCVEFNSTPLVRKELRSVWCKDKHNPRWIDVFVYVTCFSEEIQMSRIGIKFEIQTALFWKQSMPPSWKQASRYIFEMSFTWLAKISKFLSLVFFSEEIKNRHKFSADYYFSSRPRGLMDKASDFGSEDSRFKSWRGRFCSRITSFLLIYKANNTPTVCNCSANGGNVCYYCAISHYGLEPE